MKLLFGQCKTAPCKQVKNTCKTKQNYLNLKAEIPMSDDACHILKFQHPSPPSSNCCLCSVPASLSPHHAVSHQAFSNIYNKPSPECAAHDVGKLCHWSKLAKLTTLSHSHIHTHMLSHSHLHILCMQCIHQHKLACSTCHTPTHSHLFLTQLVLMYCMANI